MLNLSFLKNNVIGIVLSLLFIGLIIVLSIGKNAIQFDKQGDAAIFEQLTDNIATGKGPVSNVFANTQDYIENRYASKTNEELFAALPNGPENTERNMLKFHAYYILYPISWLEIFFDSSFILSFVQLSVYLGLLWSCFLFIRKNHGTIAIALFSSLLVFLNPNWFVGVLGQFYPDRLFVLFGFLFMWALFARIPFKWLCLLSIFVCLINERAALIAGLVVFLHEAVHFDFKEKKFNGKMLVLAGFMVAFFYIHKNVLIDNLYYGGFIPRNWGGFVANWNAPGFAVGILKNIENNGFLLLFACFAPRYLLIALAILSINLIGNVGGAEKIGWITHYHVYYFPILVFASCVGIVNLSALVGSKTFGSNLLKVVLFLIILINIGLQGKGNLNGYQIGPSAALSSYSASFKSVMDGQVTGLKLKQEFQTLFSNDDVVSTNEAGMVLLHNKTRVSFFPIGLTHSSKVLIGCNELDKPIGDVTLNDKLISFGFMKVDSDVQLLKSTGFCLLSKR